MVISTIVTLGLFVISLPAFGQNQSGQQQQTEKPLPVLLIHGYAEDAPYGKNGRICSEKMASSSLQ